MVLQLSHIARTYFGGERIKVDFCNEVILTKGLNNKVDRQKNLIDGWLFAFFQDKKLVDFASLSLHFAFWISLDMVKMQAQTL